MVESLPNTKPTNGNIIYTHTRWMVSKKIMRIFHSIPNRSIHTIWEEAANNVKSQFVIWGKLLQLKLVFRRRRDSNEIHFSSFLGSSICLQLETHHHLLKHPVNVALHYSCFVHLFTSNECERIS